MYQPAEFREKYREIIDRYIGYNVLYTDGSKSVIREGAAVVGEAVRRGASVPGIATILTAKLIAIKLALFYIKYRKMQKAVIVTDSLTTIQCLKQFDTKNPPVE